MAIQMRRGEYDDFDASKMLAGELAVVVSGDPETEGGALYVATAAGSATRVAFANEVPTEDATPTSDGLMSAADKAKLDSVAAGAQANVIESVSVNGNNATVTGKAAAVTIPEATDAASGVMGAADKAKLDGIAEGAKKVTITEGTRGSGAKVVSFSVQNPDGTFEFPPSAVKADSNGYVDMTSVANGSIPNSKLATPYSLPTMSASAKGGATVGDGLAMTGDALGIADEGVEMGMLSQDVQEAIDEGVSGSKLAATAEALLGADETAQWARRMTEGSGAATVRSVQGASVAWNQLINSSTPLPQTSLNGITITNNGDGTYTVNGTATAITVLKIEPEKSYKAHKHLLKGCPSNASGCSLRMRGAVNDAIDTGSGAFWNATNNTWKTPVVYVDNGATIDSLVFTPQLFDLTQMFGSGNEPATVEEFEAMFPEAYYPYSAPTLKPVQIAGIQSTDAQGGELDSIEWTTQTLWGAGAIGDMLYTDHKETKIGLIDLGTLNWTAANTIVAGSYRMRSDVIPTIIDIPSSGLLANIRCVKYDTITGSAVYTNNKGISLSSGQQLAVFDPDYNQEDSAAAFKAAMSGVMCAYELATPTTTPISPVLPMTYRVQQGGTESIIVPDGEVSAAPVLTVAEGESAVDVVMDALACVATPDGPTATANHALNTYLTMGGKLYKVTRAIAVGETITPNTNITETTVMDELIALTQ